MYGDCIRKPSENKHISDYPFWANHRGRTLRSSSIVSFSLAMTPNLHGLLNM
jgi:hypothetical protein